MEDYIPSHIRLIMSRPFVEGYALCFSAIGNVLERGQKPTPTAILSEFMSSRFEPLYVSSYISNGGLTEHALNAILHRSWEEVSSRGLSNFKIDC